MNLQRPTHQYWAIRISRMHSFSKRNLLAADSESDCSIPAAKRQELEAETKQEFDWDSTKIDIGWLEPEYNPQYGADASQSTSKHVFETTLSDPYQSSPNNFRMNKIPMLIAINHILAFRIVKSSGIEPATKP